MSNYVIPWGDVMDLDDEPELFHAQDDIIVSEKIAGSRLSMTYIPQFDELILDDDEFDIIADKFEVKDVMRNLYRTYPFADRIAIFGEVCGEDIYPSMHYGLPWGYVIYDIFLEWGRGYLWVDQMQIESLMRDMKPSLEVVPLLYTGKYNFEFLESLSYGMEMVSGHELHIREGIVVRTNLFDGKRHLYTDNNARPVGALLNPEYIALSLT